MYKISILHIKSLCFTKLNFLYLKGRNISVLLFTELFNAAQKILKIRSQSLVFLLPR